MSKINIDTINDVLNKEGWNLVSTEYSNLDTELEFKCSEGHRVFSTWRKIRNKRECPICKQNTLKVEKFKVAPKKFGTTRVLALDQATHITGWSIIDDKELKAFGTFTSLEGEEIERFNDIKKWLINMIENWKPDCIGIEGIQYQQHIGVTTFQTLARLQGILMECCYELGIEFVICPTNTWRAHCEVKGRARADKKKSMQLLIKKWYDVSVTEDEADAIGIGRYVSENFTKTVEMFQWE